MLGRGHRALGARWALSALAGAALVLGVPGVAGALTTLPVPSNVGAGGLSLTASSCPSAGSCSAVAGYTDGPDQDVEDIHASVSVQVDAADAVTSD